MKKLYLITNGFGDYYVIANDPTEAEKALTKIFDDQDYGFSHKRDVKNIKVVGVAFEPDYKNEKQPFLSGNSNLLIIDDWEGLK